MGKEIDSPRRVNTGCTPQFSDPALLPAESALIAKAFTLPSEGAAEFDYMAHDHTNLNNRSTCTQLENSVQCAHPGPFRLNCEFRLIANPDITPFLSSVWFACLPSETLSFRNTYLLFCRTRAMISFNSFSMSSRLPCAV
jgi:hypothetical protein